MSELFTGEIAFAKEANDPDLLQTFLHTEIDRAKEMCSATLRRMRLVYDSTQSLTLYSLFGNSLCLKQAHQRGESCIT
jgi:hypothetical protein